MNSEDDTILAHRDSSLISLKLRDIDDPFMQGVADRIETWDYSLTEINNNMTAFAEIEGTDWILVSYVPSATIYKEVNEFRNIIVVIAVISLLILTILIERVVHVTIKPVKELTKLIQAMTDGDFTVQVKTGSNDEIGLMGKCVEKFVVSMRGMISAIYGVSSKLQEQADSSNDVSGQMYDASRLQKMPLR